MKSFDELYAELVQKVQHEDPDSGTYRIVSAGVHACGKKVVEEAAESWMAAEHEGHDRAADEIAQLLYTVQCLMLASDISLDDVYRRL